MSLRELFSTNSIRQKIIVEGEVVPDPFRCVQCGVCSYHCPIGIDIRGHAWKGISIIDSRCITCGECVARCPRGALSFKRSNLFEG